MQSEVKIIHIIVQNNTVDNVVKATKGLQDKNINIIAGTTVENKGKLILTENSHRCKNMIFFSIDAFCNLLQWENVFSLEGFFKFYSSL